MVGVLLKSKKPEKKKRKKKGKKAHGCINKAQALVKWAVETGVRLLTSEGHSCSLGNGWRLGVRQLTSEGDGCSHGNGWRLGAGQICQEGRLEMVDLLRSWG